MSSKKQELPASTTKTEKNKSKENYDEKEDYGEPKAKHMRYNVNDDD